MRPAPFRYFAPQSAEAALRLLAEHGETARLLAGGQSLVPLMNLRIGRPAALIDLNRCAGLAYVERRADCVAYGAMTRQIDAQHAPETLAGCPLVAQALAHAGPVAVRNRATIGGTLAHADRTAELPGAAVALDAVLVVDGPAGTRAVPAREFFVADLTTAIRPGEMLREARFPLAPPESFSLFLEAGVRQRDMAVAGLAASFEMKGRALRAARLAVIGVEATPVRLDKVEARLRAEDLAAAAIPQLARLAQSAIDPIGDVHATAGYRRQVVGALLSQALEQALGRMEKR